MQSTRRFCTHLATALTVAAVAVVTLILTPHAAACDYAVRSYVRHDVVVETPVVVAVATPVFIPVYGAGYVPQPVAVAAPAAVAAVAPAAVAAAAPAAVAAAAPAQQVASSNTNAEILSALKRLEAREAALEAKLAQPNMPPPKDQSQKAQPPDSHAPRAALATNCAVCHTAGKEFHSTAGKVAATLFNADGTSQMTDHQIRLAINKVKYGKMPPPDSDVAKTFTGETLTDCLDDLDSLEGAETATAKPPAPPPPAPPPETQPKP